MPALKPFIYEKPESLEQLSRLLTDNQGIKPVYLAGGTDLLVAIRKGKDTPQWVIDLKGLPGLCGIRRLEGDKLWIGALTPIHGLETDPIVKEKAAALYEGAQNLGSWQVRNRGTIGGNLGNGAPTADTAAPLLAMDAEVLIWGPREERRISIGSFWLGAGKTCLNTGEIITAVEIPIKTEYTSAYLKLGPRKAMDIAIASAAVVLTLSQGIISDIRIALGGAGSTPIRACSAESFLTGQQASEEKIKQAGLLAVEDCNPRTSSRATREYRMSVFPVLVERSIKIALMRQDAFQV